MYSKPAKLLTTTTQISITNKTPTNIYQPPAQLHKMPAYKASNLRIVRGAPRVPAPAPKAPMRIVRIPKSTPAQLEAMRNPRVFSTPPRGTELRFQYDTLKMAWEHPEVPWDWIYESRTRVQAAKFGPTAASEALEREQAWSVPSHGPNHTAPAIMQTGPTHAPKPSRSWPTVQVQPLHTPSPEHSLFHGIAERPCSSRRPTEACSSASPSVEESSFEWRPFPYPVAVPRSDPETSYGARQHAEWEAEATEWLRNQYVARQSAMTAAEDIQPTKSRLSPSPAGRQPIFLQTERYPVPIPESDTSLGRQQLAEWEAAAVIWYTKQAEKDYLMMDQSTDSEPTEASLCLASSARKSIPSSQRRSASTLLNGAEEPVVHAENSVVDTASTFVDVVNFNDSDDSVVAAEKPVVDPAPTGLDRRDFVRHFVAQHAPKPRCRSSRHDSVIVSSSSGSETTLLLGEEIVPRPKKAQSYFRSRPKSRESVASSRYVAAALPIVEDAISDFSSDLEGHWSEQASEPHRSGAVVLPVDEDAISDFSSDLHGHWEEKDQAAEPYRCEAAALPIDRDVVSDFSSGLDGPSADWEEVERATELRREQQQRKTDDADDERSTSSTDSSWCSVASSYAQKVVSSVWDVTVSICSWLWS